MQLITHESHLGAIPASDLTTHIQQRFAQQSLDTDLPPSIYYLEPSDTLDDAELSFLGESGVYSDIFGEHRPGESGFQTVFDWISYDPGVPVYEMLYLKGDLGYTFIFGPEVLDTHPLLKALVDSQPLSPPQPLY